MLRTVLSPVLAILTILIIPSVSKALVFLPLIFGLSVALVNYKSLKANYHIVGVSLSLLQTYLVFLGLAIVIYFLDEFSEDLSFLNSDSYALKGIILVTIGGYLAALLLFYFATYLYNVSSRRFGYSSITLCYAVVVLVMQIFSKNEFLQFGIEKFASFLISWVIFMSLGFSIALNREEFIRFFKRK